MSFWPVIRELAAPDGAVKLYDDYKRFQQTAEHFANNINALKRKVTMVFYPCHAAALKVDQVVKIGE